MGALLHPVHRSVMTGFEPGPEISPARRPNLRAQSRRRQSRAPPLSLLLLPQGFGSYSPTACTSPIAIFVGNSVLQQVSHSAFSSAFAVQAIDLVKDFGETRAVDGVSLAVPPGSIYGLLGPNGAGKTTILRMLIGIIDPSSGIASSSRPRAAARSRAARLDTCPRSEDFIPRCMHAKPSPSWVRFGDFRCLRGAAAQMCCSQSTILANGRRKPIRTFRRAWRRPSSCSARSFTVHD